MQRDTKPSIDITILPVKYGEEVKSGLSRNRWRSLYRCIKTNIGIHRHRIQTDTDDTDTKKLNTRIQTDQFWKVLTQYVPSGICKSLS